MTLGSTLPLRIGFDETHSESWSIDHAQAGRMQPENAANSCYSKAARRAELLGFGVSRLVVRDEFIPALDTLDVLVLVHPCDDRWEATTGGSPVFSPDEIAALQDFVRRGRSLLVISEYEHEKYGSNLNELLAPFGITIENTTVVDRQHSAPGNQMWIHAAARAEGGDRKLLAAVDQATFYRCGSISVRAGARSMVVASETAKPARATLIAGADDCPGRLCVAADSDLFGDDYFEIQDHAQLWENILLWLVAHRQPATAQHEPPPSGWDLLARSVDELRHLQADDGSVALQNHDDASKKLDDLHEALDELAKLPEHEHLTVTKAVLERWRDAGWTIPDFRDAAAAFQPQLTRTHGRRIVTCFCQTTPNGPVGKRLEAVLLETVWPSWLAEIERLHANKAFVSARLLQHTRGYDSECAVFFPEMIAVPDGLSESQKPKNSYGIIFCNREAARFISTSKVAINLFDVNAPPMLLLALEDPVLVENVFSLWDLVHDRAHTRGPLPFDIYLVRMQHPFWMDALEELRVDLASCEAAAALEARTPYARLVTLAVVFDRLFRFPISGSREHNYDALAGQILFAHLAQSKVVIHNDGKLFFDWKQLHGSLTELHDRIKSLYTSGRDLPEIHFWGKAHEFTKQYCTPQLGSQWVHWAEFGNIQKADVLLRVMADEFPLSQFYTRARERMFPDKAQH